MPPLIVEDTGARQNPSFEADAKGSKDPHPGDSSMPKKPPNAET